MMDDPAVLAYVEMTEMLRIGTLNSEYVHQKMFEQSSLVIYPSNDIITGHARWIAKHSFIQ